MTNSTHVALHGNFSAISPSLWALPDMIKAIIAQLPILNMTADNVLIVDNATFITQEVQCLWPISGRYGPTLRVMFYLLALGSLCMRNESWIAGVTMGIAMTYSSVAAIHAIIMVIIRTQLVSQAVQWVSIASGSLTDAPKIPVWPMTWDEDGDPTLAIVGVGYLLVTPMMIWSDTFQNAQAGSKPVLFAWAFLMLVGLICALISEAYVDLWAFAQFRFCSHSEGGLPDLNSLYGRQPIGKNFNESIWTLSTSSPGSFTTCIYPCFDVSWPIRQLKDIKVINSGSTSQGISNYANTNTGWRLMFAVYFLVTASGLTSLGILIIQRAGHYHYNRGDPRISSTELRHEPLMIFDYWAKFLSIVSLLFFLGWIEWVIWPYPNAERFRDVGQWGQFTTVILVLLAALYSNRDRIFTWFMARLFELLLN